MTPVALMEVNETDTNTTDEKPRPKVGRIPVTLRMLNENEVADDADVWPEAALASRKGDTQFMLLLVALFIVVNLTLITLINRKDKSAAAKPETAIAEHHNAPATTAVAPTLAPTLAPAAVTPAPVVQQPVPPAPAVILPAASKPVSVAAPVAAPPSPPAANAYVTPATAGTTTIAAPFHPVTVVDHTAAAPAAAPVTEEHLTVMHPAQAPVATAAPETMSPAAGTPTPVSSDAAKQDLLSVINKD